MSFEKKKNEAAFKHAKELQYNITEAENFVPKSVVGHIFCEGWSAAEQELGWQSIETAPKDGTWIFLSNHIGEVWVGKITRSGPPQYQVEMFHYKEFPNDYHDEIKGKATRWMAIPSFDTLIGDKPITREADFGSKAGK